MPELHLIFQFLLPVIIGTFLLVFRKKMGTWYHPGALFVIWWGFWLWISCFSLTGIYIASPKTQWLVVSMLGMTVVGALWGDKIAGRSKPRDQLDIFFVGFEKIKWFMILAAVVPVGLAFVRALWLFYSRDISLYKGQAFANADGPGILFGSSLLQGLYFIWTGPVILFLILIGLALYFKNRQVLVLFVGVATSLMDSILRMGRSNAYAMVLFIAFCTFLFFEAKARFAFSEESWLKTKRYAVGTFASLAVLILVLGSIRNDRVIKNLGDQLEIYVIDYHTMGFYFFDAEISSPNSPVHTPAYGRLNFGGLETLFTLVLRQFDRNYTSPAHANMVYAYDDRAVGEYYGGKKKFYNSFFTGLYSLYGDFGAIGVPLGGLLMGFVLAFNYRRWLRFHAWSNFVWMELTLFVGVFSIFISQMENMRTWIAIILLSLCHLLGRNKTKAA